MTLAAFAIASIGITASIGSSAGPHATTTPRTRWPSPRPAPSRPCCVTTPPAAPRAPCATGDVLQSGWCHSDRDRQRGRLRLLGACPTTGPRQPRDRLAGDLRRRYAARPCDRSPQPAASPSSTRGSSARTQSAWTRTATSPATWRPTATSRLTATPSSSAATRRSAAGHVITNPSKHTCGATSYGEFDLPAGQPGRRAHQQPELALLLDQPGERPQPEDVCFNGKNGVGAASTVCGSRELYVGGNAAVTLQSGELQLLQDDHGVELRRLHRRGLGGADLLRLAGVLRLHDVGGQPIQQLSLDSNGSLTVNGRRRRPTSRCCSSARTAERPRSTCVEHLGEPDLQPELRRLRAAVDRRTWRRTPPTAARSPARRSTLPPTRTSAPVTWPTSSSSRTRPRTTRRAGSLSAPRCRPPPSPSADGCARPTDPARRSRGGGFTLTELLVSMGIGLAVVASGVLVFTSAIRAEPKITNRSAQIQQARTVAETVTRELRQGSNATSASPSQLQILTFIPKSSCASQTAGVSIRCKVFYSCSTAGACTRQVCPPNTVTPARLRVGLHRGRGSVHESGLRLLAGLARKGVRDDQARVPRAPTATTRSHSRTARRFATHRWGRARDRAAGQARQRGRPDDR